MSQHPPRIEARIALDRALVRGARHPLELWAFGFLAGPSLGRQLQAGAAGRPLVMPLRPALVRQRGRRGGRDQLLAAPEGALSQVRLLPDLALGRAAHGGLSGPWIVGIAGLLVEAPGGGRSGGNPNAQGPRSALRRQLADFRLRLQIALARNASRALRRSGNQAVSALDLLRGQATSLAEEPDAQSALGRLAAGPAHRLIHDLVPDRQLRKQRARAALIGHLRGEPLPAWLGTPDTAAIALPTSPGSATLPGAPPPLPGTQQEPGPQADLFVASLIRARILPTLRAAGPFEFELDMTSSEAGLSARLQGRFSLAQAPSSSSAAVPP